MRFSRRAIWVPGCLILLLMGCTLGKPERLTAYREREKAFKLVDEGQSLEAAGNRLLALERYNRAALIYDSPMAYYRMGKMFEAAGKYEAAATAFGKAVELAPDYREARVEMLSLGYQPDNYTPTEEDLELAEAIKRRREAELAAATPQPQVAEEEEPDQSQLIETAAVQRRPTLAEVRAVIFSPEARQPQLPSALDPTYPNDKDIILGTYAYHFHKAQQLIRREKFEEAADEFRSALAADPSQIDARLELGDMMLRLERYPQGLYHYEQAIHDFPESPRPYFKLGNYYADMDRVDRAREYYRQSIEKDPYYIESYNNLAVLAMREKDWQQAKDLLDEVIQLNPTYANAYLNRGIIASDIDQDREKALWAFRRYVDLEGARAEEVRRWIRDLETQGG